MERSAPRDTGEVLRLYVTASDFALTTWEAGEVVSGMDVRRIGLTPPWEDSRAWKRLVRGVIGEQPAVVRPLPRSRPGARVA